MKRKSMGNKALKFLKRGEPPRIETKAAHIMLQELKNITPCMHYIYSYYNTRMDCFHDWLMDLYERLPIVRDFVEHGSINDLFDKYKCVWKKSTCLENYQYYQVLNKILREDRKESAALAKTIHDAWRSEQMAKWHTQDSSRLTCFRQAVTCMKLGYSRITNVTKKGISIGKDRYAFHQRDRGFWHTCNQVIELTPQRVDGHVVTEKGVAYAVMLRDDFFDGDLHMNCIPPFTRLVSGKHSFFLDRVLSTNTRLTFRCHCRARLGLWYGIEAMYEVGERFHLPHVLTNMILDWLPAAVFEIF